jgi:hypothetical protein
VKLVRVLSRIAILSLVATALAGLTEIYGSSVQSPLPDPIEQAERQHHPSEPEVSQFPEFVCYVVLFLFWVGIGRAGLRLRLSPVSRNEEQPISLNLHRRREGQAS